LTKPLGLVCQAGTPPSLRAVADAGADAVYLGFRDVSNACNFPDLNFNQDEISDCIIYAYEYSAKALLAINTYPRRATPHRRGGPRRRHRHLGQHWARRLRSAHRPRAQAPQFMQMTH
jgi:collagenase-like PrtC family protease